MKHIKTMFILFTLAMVIVAGISCKDKRKNLAQNDELPVYEIKAFLAAAEAYFSHDGKSIICNAKMKETDKHYNTYTCRKDGSKVTRINDKWEDACSWFTRDGKGIIYTSTRDEGQTKEEDWSSAKDYPKGAELYWCDLKGKNVKRITKNKYYDAEVSESPDSKWILFSRQINGEIDLWKMRPDGSNEIQITKTPEWQEGGSFYIPGTNTIIFRAWKKSDEGKRGMPMAIFTIDDNGKNLKMITDDKTTNWAPFPHKDQDHFVFVKVLPPVGGKGMPNYEIFMRSLKTGKETRLTYSPGFDGFPTLSPDGNTLLFSSSRTAPKGKRQLNIFTMDISSLFKNPEE